MEWLLRSSVLFFCLHSTMAALTKDQLFAALSDVEPIIFDTVPSHTLQNVAIILPVEGKNSPEQSNSLQLASDSPGLPIPVPVGSREIPASGILQNQDPMVLSRDLVELSIPKSIPVSNTMTNREPVLLPRQEVEMPKGPASIAKSGTLRNVLPGLPKPKRAGRRRGMLNLQKARRGSKKLIKPMNMDAPLVSGDFITTSHAVPTPKADVIIDNRGRIPASNDNVMISDLVNSETISANLNADFFPQLQGGTVSFLELEEYHNRQCPFQIHFSNLPDIFMRRDEFDQLYLLPALQAHFMGGRCRTNGLIMYIEWLFYLRNRIFL